jgi:hypothetical protein
MRCGRERGRKGGQSAESRSVFNVDESGQPIPVAVRSKA